MPDRSQRGYAYDYRSRGGTAGPLVLPDGYAISAVIGVPDVLRGQVVKAYIVTSTPTVDTRAHIQAFMKAQLSQHEYPRQIEFLAELPKTPAGKVNRQALRERAQRMTG